MNTNQLTGWKSELIPLHEEIAGKQLWYRQDQVQSLIDLLNAYEEQNKLLATRIPQLESSIKLLRLQIKFLCDN